MQLGTVQLERYKNLRSTPVDFGSLNLFVGPNGSGKSNLIQALSFLKKAVEGIHLSDLSNVGPGILDRHLRSPNTVSFSYTFLVPDREPVRLELSLGIPDQAHLPVYISREMLLSNPDAPRPFKFYDLHEKREGSSAVSVFDDDKKKKSHFAFVDAPTNRLGLAVMPEILEASPHAPEDTPVFARRREIVETLAGWRFYNANAMDLNLIRHAEPKLGQSDLLLDPSGTNLALVIFNQCNKSIDFEEGLNDAMRQILPMTRRLRAVPAGRTNLTLEWHVSDFAEPFFLDEMSDGTIRMLCWAVILKAPTLPTLLVLDEPELGIHIAWLPILAEWIKEASTRTQVVVSTHSADLLDAFTEDHLERVFRFCPDDRGYVQIKQLTRDEVAIQLDEEGWTLGDLFRCGDPNFGAWPW